MQHDEPKIIKMPKPSYLGYIKIYSATPIYHTNQVLLIVNDDPRFEQYDIEKSEIEYRWTQINYPGEWAPCPSLYSPEGFERTTGAYLPSIPDTIKQDLLQDKPCQLQLRFKDEILTLWIKDHGLRTRLENDLIPAITAHKTLYFGNPTVFRGEGHLNDECGSIIRRIIPWVEYHLHHGLSQIFIHQPTRFTHLGPDWTDFWIDLLKPYLEDREVILILSDDLDAIPAPFRDYVSGTNMWSMWVNKGRCKWMSTNDLDEYIVPYNKDYWEEGISSIADILDELSSETNFMVIPHRAISSPAKEKILIAGDKIAQNFLPTEGKFFVKVNDANLIWTHGIMSWSKSPHHSIPLLRSNHYKSSLELDDFIKWNWDDNVFPSNTNNRLSSEHETILSKIKTRYTTSHGEHLRHLQSKYPDLEELARQDLSGE